MGVVLLWTLGVRAECPVTVSAQAIDLHFYGSTPIRHSVDIAASTTSQDSYLVVIAPGEPRDSYVTGVAYREYDTSNHTLQAYGDVDSITRPGFRKDARVDNLNFLGILGGWLTGWNAWYQKGDYQDQTMTRSLASDLSPINDTLYSFPGTLLTEVQDVAALPGLNRGVQVAAGLQNGAYVAPLLLRYIEMDGSLGDLVPVSAFSSSGWAYPAVASSVVGNTAKVVVTWSHAGGLIYFRVFDADGNPLTPATATDFGIDSDVAALPTGFAIAYTTGTGSNRSVKVRTFDWNGSQLQTTTVTDTVGNYVNPSISGTMYPAGDLLYPYWGITYTNQYESYGLQFIVRYFRLGRNLGSPMVWAIDPTIFHWVAGQSFYPPDRSTEYRNSLKLFSGCSGQIVAGIVWNQTQDSNTSLYTYRSFIGVGGGGLLNTSAPSGIVETSIDPMSPPPGTLMLDDGSFALADPNLMSPVFTIQSPGESTEGIPDCYDYRVGSCVLE